MKQKSIVFIIEEIEKKLDSAKLGKETFLKQNPIANVSRFNEHIVMCEKAINQFNMKLLNSEYKIDESLLKYIIEEFDMKRHLEKITI